MKTKNHILDDQHFSSWLFLARTRDAILRNRMKELRKYGISARQAIVLMVLEGLGGRASPAEVSRCSFREPHSISDFLKRMERDGLVRRLKNQDKKSRVCVVLTAKGCKAIDNARKLETIHRIMSCLTDKEHEKLKEMLKKIWDKSLEGLGIENRPIFPNPR